MENLRVLDNEYKIIKLLGKGKGGYSYLVHPINNPSQKYVLKQIHHEPCSYYSFGNKIEAELRDYKKLNDVGINIPKMICCDENNERIIKEYIEGPTIFELVRDQKMDPSFVDQVKQMCAKLYPANLNIDYFPTNFVVQENIIYYIDYECNGYMDEWNFENWGIKYWSKTPEFIEYLKNNSPA